MIIKNVDEVLFGYTYKGLYFSVNIFGMSATTVNTSQITMISFFLTEDM